MFQSLIGELKTYKICIGDIIRIKVSIPHRRAKNLAELSTIDRYTAGFNPS